MSHTDHTDQSGPGRPPAGQPGRTPGGAEVSPELRRQIDENLRRLYCAPVDDGLPEHLQALVERLRNRSHGA